MRGRPLAATGAPTENIKSAARQEKSYELRAAPRSRSSQAHAPWVIAETNDRFETYWQSSSRRRTGRGTRDQVGMRARGRGRMGRDKGTRAARLHAPGDCGEKRQD